MTDQIFYIFSAVLLGLVIGALLMYFASGSNKDSKKSVAKMEKKLDRYQKDVSEHFEQTADLVDELTQSYKKVFDHLGKSAKHLMTDEQIQHQIEKRKGNKVTLEFLTDDNNANETVNKDLEAEETIVEPVDEAKDVKEIDLGELSEQDSVDESEELGGQDSIDENEEKADTQKATE